MREAWQQVRRFAGRTVLVGFLALPGMQALGTPAPAEAGVVTCQGRLATIVGTQGDDDLRGTPGPDVIQGLAGNDQIRGEGGDDVVCGGAGNDVISGGPGDDRLFGFAGSDNVNGNDGADIVEGGDGNDHVRDWGNDVLRGNDGRDRMSGSGGNDTLISNPTTGEQGNPDVLQGFGGTDTLDALDGQPNDVVNAGPGDDRCRTDHGEPRISCERSF